MSESYRLTRVRKHGNEQLRRFRTGIFLGPCRLQGLAISIGDDDSCRQCSRSQDPVADLPAVLTPGSCFVSFGDRTVWASRRYGAVEKIRSYQQNVRNYSGLDSKVRILNPQNKQAAETFLLFKLPFTFRQDQQISRPYLTRKHSLPCPTPLTLKSL